MSAANKRPLELVDGQQRIKTVLAFLKNEIPIFGGHFYKDIQGNMNIFNTVFHFHVNKLQTEKEVIEWYLRLNTGCSIHTEKDLKPAYEILKQIEEKQD